jgi:U4/U6 small nuclear ribonucleoprotein PRP3
MKKRNRDDENKDSSSSPKRQRRIDGKYSSLLSTLAATKASITTGGGGKYSNLLSTLAATKASLSEKKQQRTSAKDSVCQRLAAKLDAKQVQRKRRLFGQSESSSRNALVKSLKASDDVDFDERVPVASATRKRRTNLHFLEAGSLVRQADERRRRQAVAVVALAHDDGDVDALIHDQLVFDARRQFGELPAPPPSVEWWDEPFAETETEKRKQQKKKKDLVSALVQHPQLIGSPPSVCRAADEPMRLMLTEQERAKWRRRRRRQRVEEERAEILLGLREAPPPRVRLSSLHRFLAHRNVADVTQLERQVRDARDERIAKHEARVEASRLSADEKRKRRAAKLRADASHGAVVAVFRVECLDSTRHRQRVISGARRSQMTGAAVARSGNNAFSIVVVEGDDKSIRHFRNLMLRRVRWRYSNESDERERFAANQCTLLWQGHVVEPNMPSFHLRDNIESPLAARQLFARYNVAHYWDLAQHPPPPPPFSFRPHPFVSNRIGDESDSDISDDDQ